MKRDMDLIRSLLLRLESLDLGNGVYVLRYEDDLMVEGHDSTAIDYHVAQIVDAGFLNVPEGMINPSPGIWCVVGLSWEGHEFIDAVREPKAWKKTKEIISAVGSHTLKGAAEVAKAYVTSELKAKLGLPL